MHDEKARYRVLQEEFDRVNRKENNLHNIIVSREAEIRDIDYRINQ